MKPTLALLATGDEIVEGDVINTASPAIAQALKPLGIRVNTQMACDDQQSQITKALRYLLQDHSMVIITGGLGPTCDDRTRYSLSEVIHEKLELNEASWQRVHDFIMKFRGEVPDNNKQQSLFPKSANIIINTTGTADGCHVSFQDKDIFMLPGPPSQSLPMVQGYIYSFLKSKYPNIPDYRASWMLINASESHLATLVDAALGEHSQKIDVGYRFSPPYLQFKLKSDNLDHLTQARQLLSNTLAPYIWQEGSTSAQEQIKNIFKQTTQTFFFEDQLTQGQLNLALVNPDNFKHMIFSPTSPSHQTDYTIILKAPIDLFTAIKNGDYYFQFEWQMTITHHEKILSDQHYSHRLSRHFAKNASVEWVCIELLKILPQVTHHDDIHAS
jgi:nicotinamide-nucleotide amidase